MGTGKQGWEFSGRVILGPCACHKSGKGKVEGWKERIYASNIPRNRILQYIFLILFVYSERSFGILWRLRRLFGISRRLSIHLLDFGRVGVKTLNDKKSEWPKSRNSKLSKFKCRKAIITNDSKVLNKNLRTQRCRKKFKSKANIRMLEITKGKITN